MWKGSFWKTSGEKWLSDWRIPERYKKHGILSDINTKRKYIIVDDEEYNIKGSVNIYIYDENANTRNKYKVNEALSYIDYDDEEEVWYANGEEISSAPTVYLYIYDGDVVDLVYYIN